MACLKERIELWVLLVAAALMEAPQTGLVRHSTLLYQYLLYFYSNNSPTEVALILALDSCIRQLAAPFSGMLINLFGVGRMAITAGVILFLCMILSAFSPSIWILYITLGLMRGFGFGMVLVTRSSSIQQSFGEERARAISSYSCVCWALGGVGIPPFIDYIFNNYSLFGVFLIGSALALNIVPLGMVLALIMKLGKRKESRQKAKVLKAAQTEPESSQGLLPTTPTTETSTLPNTPPDEAVSQANMLLTPVNQTECTISNKATNTPPTLKAGEEVSESETKDLRSTVMCNSKADTQSGCGTCCQKLILLFGLDLLQNRTLFTMCSLLFLFGIYNQAYLVLISGLVYEKGFSNSQLIFILSLSSGLDIVARLVAGFVLDIPSIRRCRNQVFTLITFFTGAVCTVLPLVPGIPFTMVTVIILTQCAGIVISQMTTVMADLVPKARITSSIALMFFFMGIGNIIGPISGAWLTERTGTHKTIFHVIGIILSLGSILTLITNSRLCKTSSPSKKST